MLFKTTICIFHQKSESAFQFDKRLIYIEEKHQIWLNDTAQYILDHQP